MRRRARIKVLLNGDWCPGEVWDWETDGYEWWAIGSARPESGKTYIGRVPESQVHVDNPTSVPTIPPPRHAPGAATLTVHPYVGRPASCCGQRIST